MPHSWLDDGMAGEENFEKAWRQKFGDSLDIVVGRAMREKIVAAGGKLTSQATSEEVTEWTARVMESLDSLLVGPLQPVCYPGRLSFYLFSPGHVTVRAVTSAKSFTDGESGHRVPESHRLRSATSHVGD